MAKKCKTKRLKLKGYKLPKAKNGANLNYLDESSQLFTPQVNDPMLNAGSGQQTNLNEIGFGNSQYGDVDVGGGLSVAGIVGQIGSGVLEGSKNQNQARYADESGTWSQNAVSAVGPWGQAISGVSQLGESALESGYNADEFGYVDNENYYGLSESLKSGLLDPARNLEAISDDRFSTSEKIQSIALPGMQGLIGSKKDNEDAIRRKQEYQSKINQNRLSEINKDISPNQSLFKYGGNLNRLQNGGELDGVENPNDPNAIKMKLFRSNKPSVQTASYTKNTLRPRTIDNTINTLQKDYNLSRNDLINKSKTDEWASYIDSIATDSRQKYLKGDLPYQYQRGTSSIGNEVLNLLVPDVRTKKTNTRTIKPTTLRDGGYINNNQPNNRPIVRKYNGQTHKGNNGGIPVDKQGNPSSMTNKSPVALTEKNEVVYNGYVFSDKIKYKK